MARQREIYIIAANWLQTAASSAGANKAELMTTIAKFYTKARALDQLASYLEVCAQDAVDEFRDYEKALGFLREALKCIIKSDAPSDQSRRGLGAVARSGVQALTHPARSFAESRAWRSSSTASASWSALYRVRGPHAPSSNAAGVPDVTSLASARARVRSPAAGQDGPRRHDIGRPDPDVDARGRPRAGRASGRRLRAAHRPLRRPERVPAGVFAAAVHDAGRRGSGALCGRGSSAQLRTPGAGR
jgi:hypothetical protein